MHRTIRRRPLFALFVGFTVITLGGLLNACQSSEARPSSGLIIATALPKAVPTVAVVSSLDAPDQAAVRFLRAFYTADYRQRDRWLAIVPPIGMRGDCITPSPKIAIQLRYKPLDAALSSMIE